MCLRVCSLLLLFMALSIDADEIPKKKVFIYNPHIGYYHTKFMATIANELHANGYHVVMLDSVVDKKVNAEYRASGIETYTVEQNAKTAKIQKNGDTSEDGLAAFWDELPLRTQILGSLSFYGRRSGYSPMMSHQCEDVLKSKEFKSIRDMKFDLAITELFDFCGVGMFHLLKTDRTMLASSMPLHEHLGEKLGLPKSFDIPTKFSVSTPGDHREEFKEFGALGIFINAVQSAIYGQEMFTYLENSQSEIFRSFSDTFPGFEPLLRNASSLIENVHPLLDLSKPTLNSIIPIGGITVQNPRKVAIEKEEEEKRRLKAENINEVIRIAKKGGKKIVIVSFGTVMDPKTMNDDTKKNLIMALKGVPEAIFFWKVNDIKDIPKFGNIPDNLKIDNWLPQDDLLVSGDVDLFVSHIGIGSMTEAAYSGVPMVAIPLFVEQHYNYICARRLGIALHVDKSSLASSPDTLRDTIKKALNNEDLRKNSTRLKKNLEAFGDQRNKMMEHINFTISLPADSTPMAFYNYHRGLSFSLSIMSLFHFLPHYVGHLAIIIIFVVLPFIFRILHFFFTKEAATWTPYKYDWIFSFALGVVFSLFPYPVLIHPIKTYYLTTLAYFISLYVALFASLAYFQLIKERHAYIPPAFILISIVVVDCYLRSRIPFEY